MSKQVEFDALVEEAIRQGGLGISPALIFGAIGVNQKHHAVALS